MKKYRSSKRTLVCVFLLFAVGLPLLMTANLGSCQYDVVREGSQTLYPGDTMLLEIPYNGNQLTVTNSFDIDAYFFYEKPDVEKFSITKPRYDEYLSPSQRKGYGFYLIKDSKVTFEWNSTYGKDITFRIIKGKSNYDYFTNDGAVPHIYLEVAASGSYDFTVEEDYDYYFAIENCNEYNDVDIFMDLEKYEYKTKEGIKKSAGYWMDVSGYSYVVLKNSGTYEQLVEYQFEGDYMSYDPFDEVVTMFFILFGLLFVGAVIFVVIITTRSSSKRKKLQSSNIAPISYDSTIGKPAYVPVNNQPGPAPRPQPGVYSNVNRPAPAPAPSQAPVYYNQRAPVQPQRQAPAVSQKVAIDVCPYCGSTLDLATRNAYLAGNAVCSYCKSHLN